MNPVRGELTKSRSAAQISQSFSISEEDAYQIMEKAPVLLLEDLPLESAQKIKDYFSEAGLEIILTNNPLQKRKCFKTVWPEEPRLTFAKPEGIRKEALSSEQAIACIRTEINGEESASPRKAVRRGEDFEVQRKHESLLRQFNLLTEEKSIQDKKIEALGKEIAFLREKDMTTCGSLEAVTVEKENLLHELEAVRTKNELIVKQAAVEGSPHEKKISLLEAEKKSALERLSALAKEYQDAEALWVRKLRERESQQEAVSCEVASLHSRIQELTQRLADQDKNHRRQISEECLTLREKVLRDLVKRQLEIEQEITDKEKLLRAVLSEQENLEKEIIQAKQLLQNS